MSHLNAEGKECEIESPHFVPPMGDTLGFFSCNVPEDIRNHGRCLPPFDHQHYQHHLTAEDPYAAPEERARRRAEREPARDVFNPDTGKKWIVISSEREVGDDE